MSRDVLVPRATSMQGKRRRIDAEVPEKSRRTRSVGGDSRDLPSTSDRREAKEREAFQRQLIGVFVPRALKESLEGNTHNYSDLLSHFLPLPGSSTPQLPPLLPLLRALTAHVSLIDIGVHHALVGAIINLPWATADDRFVKSYIGFCGVLVSAHPGWARDIVTMAVRGLTWQPPQPSVSSTPVTRRTFHARHHLLISHMLALIPTLPNLLQPILNRSAPNKREPEVVQTAWVRNCCELIEYCPELGARVWSSLVDRMLRIDVEITNRADEDDDDDDDEEGGVRDRGDPFDILIDQNVAGDDEDSDDESDDGEDLDPDDISSEEERDSDDDVDTTEHRKKRREMLRLMRQKLDGMLVHFLTHLDESMRGTRHIPAAELAARDMSAVPSETPSASSTPLPQTPATPTSITGMARTPPTPAQSLAHFQTLLNLFSRQILPTSATQHLPFTLFLCSSFSPAHADLFLHRLVSLALYASDTPTPTPTQPVPLAHRTAAAVYIGSLVTRARFVSDEQARTVLQYLLAYVDGKLAQAQSKNRRVAPDELSLFYAVCQAAMVIFCFRWRALTADDEVAGEMEMDFTSGREWMRDLDVLQRALTSELNPLLGCNPSVVSMFAKVAHSTGFAYCFSIIEANTHAHSKRSAPSIAGPRAARQANIDAGLDSYFPFDPYDLPRSGEFVEALYRTWDEVAVDLGGDSDSDDEAEESDESMGDEELGPGRIPVATSAGKRPLPIARGGSSFGEHRRRNILNDAGLSTSLEHMSISPVPSSVLGGA
ncbi:hypothetical protein CspHIS471_0313010 [Cutaneotrichosporon sp. HIS471]|nr:hypothetical protein CspHIS471_0313010 [Cutaneotrichosporon sp. HIS471]